ncbi:MAG: tetratricopeptide repeat protein, partial [Candidatus Rhabdochlamydia sp.]
MVISHRSLTEAGLTKIACFPCHNSTQKIRLYSFSPSFPQDLSKLYEVLQQQKRIYEGDLSQLSQDIQLRPYLLRQGTTFRFISAEYALQMQNVHLPLSLDQKHDLTQLNDDLTHWIGVLGKEPIPEEIVRSFFQSTYPNESLDPLTEALNFFITGSRLTCDEAVLPDLRCYKTEPYLQEDFTRDLYDEERKKICKMTWKALFLQLGHLKKHESIPQTKMKSYLTYALSLLNHESFQQTLTSLQKSELIFLLEPFILGNSYEGLGNYREAITYHEKDLKIALELKDRVGEGRAYCNLGNGYYRLGNYREAITYHEKALKIALELKDRVGESGAYCNLGNGYYGLGDYRQAIAYHEKDLKIALELKDRVGEGRAYGNLGN